jgi:hypothetical protein
MPQLVLPHALVRALIRWPVSSQAQARRNALVANTELARRRAEREEAERVLDGLARVVPARRAR